MDKAAQATTVETKVSSLSVQHKLLIRAQLALASMAMISLAVLASLYNQ